MKITWIASTQTVPGRGLFENGKSYDIDKDLASHFIATGRAAVEKKMIDTEAKSMKKDGEE